MMTDKEVGELWRESMRHSPDCVFTAKVADLIRKLVEERAKWYGWQSSGLDKADSASALDAAIRDFGITWKE